MIMLQIVEGQLHLDMKRVIIDQYQWIFPSRCIVCVSVVMDGISQLVVIMIRMFGSGRLILLLLVILVQSIPSIPIYKPNSNHHHLLLLTHSSPTPHPLLTHSSSVSGVFVPAVMWGIRTSISCQVGFRRTTYPTLSLWCTSRWRYCSYRGLSTGWKSSGGCVWNWNIWCMVSAHMRSYDVVSITRSLSLSLRCVTS